MKTLHPTKAIVPIFRGSGDGQDMLSALLGTAFFVGSKEELHLVTARHVFESNPIEEHEHYVFLIREEVGGKEKIAIREIRKVIASEDLDIATCPISPNEFAEPLQFSGHDPGLNEDVWSFEYSRTRMEQRQAQGKHISIEPLTHKGNVMRFYTSDFPEVMPTPSMELSYPALQGASGAPVMMATKAKQIAVCGMLVQNIEQELLPAQILTIVDGDRSLEETKYFLPHAKAIHGSVVAEFLKGCGVSSLYASEE